ncbi:MAG: DnaJ domain-containing protein [Pseudomonadota bacterium]
MRRHVVSVLLALLAAAAGAPLGRPAAALERLVMPFNCGIENGRLVVEPSSERTYLVLGRRAEQPFTACDGTAPARCRTLMLHRFDLACQGGRVPWVEVAAQLGSWPTQRAWLDKGRLNITLARRGAATTACSGPSERVLALVGPSHLLPPSKRGCVPEQVDAKPLSLPVGFAPIGELGARLVLAGGAEAVQATPAKAVLPSAFTGPRSLTERVVVSEALPPLETASLARPGDATVVAAHWPTTVIRGDAEPTGTGLVATLLTLSLLVSAAGGLAWSRGLVPAHLQRLSLSPLGLLRERIAGAALRMRAQRAASGAADASVDNAAEAVEALLGQCETAVGRLTVAGALQDVLRQEIAALRNRLGAIRAAASDGEEGGKRAGALFRAMIREIERIRRIAEGAARSLGPAARDGAALPRTESEAYEVLGVNPNVAESVLKKVVDALRMCWHPDLAGDEPDRLAREERIKQINVAWELIKGKRSAA